MPTLDGIEKMTQKILQNLPSRAPIDIFAVANFLGIPVDPVVMHHATCRIREVTTDTGAGVIKTSHIEYDGFTADGMRQRYAVAHALGHILLGHKLPESGVREDTPQNFYKEVTDPTEIAANNVAGALLVPKMALVYFMDEGRVRSVKDLAALFGVSTTCVVHRLEQLEILPTHNRER